MALKIGLVGLPNAGKSTLFQSLTRQKVLIADYPFATIEPNIGYRPIDDPRLTDLKTIYPKAKITPAVLQIIDIAGLISGASQGEGLGNQFLAHIRSTDIIAYVGGLFKDPQSAMPNLEIILTEILLADWQTLDKQRQKMAKVANEKNLLEQVEQALSLIDNQTYLYDSPLREVFQQQLGYLNLLSLKPLLLIFNLKTSDLTSEQIKQSLNQSYPQYNRVFISAQLEDELSQLESQSEIDQFLKIYHLPESGLQTITRHSLELLNWQTFLTAGDKEIKAWLIPRNYPAPLAAGVIHSDMQKGFIAAEIISFQDLMHYGSRTRAKEAGVSRLEGKNYLMQDNDIVDFRFNV